MKIVPSILAADFLRLGEQVADAERGGAERFHIDVMDGSFVPNISLGLPLVEAMRRGTTLPLEIHLMIDRPERYTEAFIKAGGDLLILHQEATPQLHRALDQVQALGKAVGVGLNPGTPLGTIEDVVEELDPLLLMTVNPGFGGQKLHHFGALQAAAGPGAAPGTARPAASWRSTEASTRRRGHSPWPPARTSWWPGRAHFAHAGGPAAGVRCPA